MKTNRQRVSSYRDWENELEFSNVDIDDIDMCRDVPIIERQNDIKIIIHVWNRGLEGVAYNRRQSTYKRVVNLLLVMDSDGNRHFCGIPTLSRLYFHTKLSHNMPHICDRCIRSFKTRENLEEHYVYCIPVSYTHLTLPTILLV